MIEPIAIAKYLILHTLLDRRNALAAAFAAAFAALGSLILTLVDGVNLEA